MKQSSDIIEVTRNVQNENRKSITWRRHVEGNGKTK